MTTSEQKQNIILQDSISHIPDTASFCTRNSISDITFHDSASFIFTIEPVNSNKFPFIFIEINSIHVAREKEFLMKKLRNGNEIPAQPLTNDWFIFAVMVSIFLYSLISVISKRFFNDMKRFFLFRGIGDPASRDMQGLFHWQSTIINLVSFLSIALFAYCAADYYEFMPEMIPGVIFWIICFVIIIVAVTIRHLVCNVTGNISGETNAFNEYILTIYLSYRYMAFILFILGVMVLYTHIFNAQSLFLAGLIMIGVVYLIRIIRVFMIFIRKNISISYLILYLCALEFLPVLILMKYVTGLF
jgi:hypothetical protein